MTDDQTHDRIAIATRLRHAREQSGLSQGQVAAKLGLQRPAISEVEAGRRKVSAEELGQLCDLFDVDANWILNRMDEVSSQPQHQFAARELAKLKPADLEMVLTILRGLKKQSGNA